MSKVVSLIRLGHGTGFARRVRRLSLQIFGKEVVRYELRAAPRALAAAGMRDLERLVKVLTGAVVSEALRLYDRFLARFPTILTGVDRATFADIVAQALNRGNMDDRALRGLIVERLARSLPELTDMMRALDRVRLRASEKLTRKWGKVQLVGGVTDGQGKQLGDLLVISRHPDGRVWVLAVFESKSVSNMDDLTRLKELPVGQHLWDYVRGRGHGVIIEGEFVKPEKLLMEPVPVRARTGTGPVVGPKNAAQRLAEMDGYYTQFIGFAPKEMSNNQALRIAAQGIQLELWRWPFDLFEYGKFQDALKAALDKAVK